MTKNKVDLTLLKRMVVELEASLTTADEVETETDKVEWMVELAKAAGLAAGIMGESSMLVADIQQLIQSGSVPAPKQSTQDLVEDLMSKLKGPGSAN